MTPRTGYQCFGLSGKFLLVIGLSSPRLHLFLILQPVTSGPAMLMAFWIESVMTNDLKPQRLESGNKFQKCYVLCI